MTNRGGDMTEEKIIISVGRQAGRQDSVCSQMANVQEAILSVAEKMEKDDKRLNKLCREFTKLKGLMYGYDNG